MLRPWVVQDVTRSISVRTHTCFPATEPQGPWATAVVQQQLSFLAVVCSWSTHDGGFSGLKASLIVCADQDKAELHSSVELLLLACLCDSLVSHRKTAGKQDAQS